MNMARKKSPQNTTIAMLRSVNKFLASLDQSDVDDILSGKLEFSLRSVKSSQSLKSGHTGSDEIGSFLQDIMEQLSTVEDTKSGIEILQSAKLTRAELETIARLIDVPILKQDAVLRLEEKILEALVGSRLNSKAIRGNG